MSFRELWVFVQHLPQESWTQTVLRDDPERQALVNPSESDLKFGPWTHGDFLSVEIIDAIRHLEVTVARSNGQDVEYPKPTQRPGMKRLARQISDSAEAVAARRYLDEFNKGLRAVE
jgi:hypothetical protein